MCKYPPPCMRPPLWDCSCSIALTHRVIFFLSILLLTTTVSFLLLTTTAMLQHSGDAPCDLLSWALCVSILLLTTTIMCMYPPPYWDCSIAATHRVIYFLGPVINFAVVPAQEVFRPFCLHLNQTLNINETCFRGL
jgi:hypothetical protein